MVGPLLKVRDLTKIYETGGRRIVACEDVSFDVYPGEVLGIVGESGSGKSTVLQCLFQDVQPTGGAAYLASFHDGARSMFEADRRERRELRTHQLSMVYQNPRMGLNLMVTAGGNVAERLLAAEWRQVSQIRAKASDYLVRTEVPIERMDDFPAYFSGGMQQRVQIAKALANGPELVLLDELTTGLDVSVQAGVLDLVRDIQQTTGMTAIIVSHDLGVIRLLTDRTLVMKDGHVVEAGLTDQILEDPQHPYTQLLVNCVTV